MWRRLTPRIAWAARAPSLDACSSLSPSRCSVLRNAQQRHRTTVADVYLERMQEYDVASFLRLLRTGVFDCGDDLRRMFSGFQRYLAHLKAEEFVEMLELFRSRELRESEGGVDLPLLLICEMNRRMLGGQTRLFSLRQCQRICTVMKHMKFNRPSHITPGGDGMVASPASDGTAHIQEGTDKMVSSPSDHKDGHPHRTPISCPNGNEGTDSICTTSESHISCTRASKDVPLFSEDMQEVTVPVCECNVGPSTTPRACAACCAKYGPLLHLPGYDQLSLLIVLLGRSIVLQLSSVRRLHENAVTGYLMLSSHLNCTLNAHILRSIIERHQAALLRSKSLRNIAIALHVAKKCKVRCGGFEKRMRSRLADIGEFEALCAGERHPVALLVALSQLIGSLVSANALPISQEVRQIGINIITYLLDHYDKFFGADSVLDEDVVSSMRGNARLLVDYLESKGVNFERIFLDSDLERLESLIVCGAVDYSKDFRTSDFHRQVGSTLSLLGHDVEEEVRIGAHVCDIVLRNGGTVVEIDGPYHFNTSLNERTNQLLNRSGADYRLTYTHNSNVKRFMLGLAGYRVVHVPFFRWPSGREEQLEYVRRALT
ncbi:RAP domain-containing protein, putative [Babesia ovata]|uniref:RAP domain-containing protein, putative n=1 Tax=Babesia ovata TaxID=189622 RepID=A0A2H6KDU6_9APIC|nr:RAP domain-containing protein, putative [Babesia ovata]GBE61129.1 RAP domain-containing protein, putative [Babesia ovata]